MDGGDSAVHRPNIIDRPKLIAHRGFAAVLPENSLPAFEAAGRAGFWAIETDVRTTKDGVLVCNHDDAVDRMYNGSGSVAAFTYRELAALRVKGEFSGIDADSLRMPTFAEYLAICREYGALPFIEAKTEDVDAIIQEACRFFREEQVIVSSTVVPWLQRARGSSDKVFLHHIFSNLEEMRRLAELGNCGASYNYPDYTACPRALLDETHRRGVLCCLRAGDSPEAVAGMLNMGLDYIPTNCVTPALLLA